MQSEQFDGRSADMKKPTNWLASEDILGLPPVKVVVEGCFRHKDAEFEGGRKETVFAIKFKDKTKQLLLNSTNRQRMVSMFGANVGAWAGQTIELTVVDCKMMGKPVKGIRIVEKKKGGR